MSMNEAQPLDELGQRRAARDLPNVIHEVIKYLNEQTAEPAPTDPNALVGFDADQPDVEPQIAYQTDGATAVIKRLYHTATDAPFLVTQRRDSNGLPTGAERTFGFSPNRTDEIYELVAGTGEMMTHFDTDIDPVSGQDYGTMTDLYVAAARSVIPSLSPASSSQ